MRRFVLGILVILGIAVLCVRADDFWVKKDWKNWSEIDCKKLLADSPWTKSWTRTGGDIGQAERYAVQDWSSIPVREAFVRETQIDNKYDEMDDAHKKEFDARAESFLSTTYDNAILIRVEYGTNIRTIGNNLMQYWKSVPEEAILANSFLINQRGDHIPPVKFDSVKNAEHAFELVFPRMMHGEPIIQDRDKTFSI